MCSLSTLAQHIASFAPRTYQAKFDPPVDLNSLFFYLFVVAQQCGTGDERSPDNNLSCGHIWRVFHDSWMNGRTLFGEIEPELFRKILCPPETHWRASHDRMEVRHRMHQQIAKAIQEYGFNILEPEILSSLEAYGDDPFDKKLNLLHLIMAGRPERWVDSERGPVVDYHVVRVFLRYLGLDLGNASAGSEDEREAEHALRQEAFWLCISLQEKFGLSFEQVDGYLWCLGREICKYDSPLCHRCPLYDSCKKDIFKKEPRVKTFWY